MLRIQGYRDPTRVRAPIRRAAGQAAAVVERLMEPEVRYRRITIDACDADGLRLAGGTTLRCAAFPWYLGACTEVAVFVLTAGERIDAELQRLHEAEEMLQMLFVETAGWLAVEAITKIFTGHLRAAVEREGRRITRRMGPGYTYATRGQDAPWPLEEQGTLFALLGPEPLPVTMLESCAMRPKMSRSGLVGIASRDPP